MSYECYTTSLRYKAWKLNDTRKNVEVNLQGVALDIVATLRQLAGIDKTPTTHDIPRHYFEFCSISYEIRTSYAPPMPHPLLDGELLR